MCALLVRCVRFSSGKGADRQVVQLKSRATAAVVVQNLFSSNASKRVWVGLWRCLGPPAYHTLSNRSCHAYDAYPGCYNTTSIHD